ncbi:TPA_asm: phage tail protein [Salmonella enterica subsp. enterica serovar Typhi str. CT18]|uniref:Phage tail protein n=1 Tax=Salmonella enterica subsp. enterica serovar Typhi str. CT18 TaxID=220341 RepID=A0A717BY33_SALTI|nr:side tail fiber protein [Salmonella enterica subsp. enterica serovar Typhi]HAD4319208.1 phage tail protein [Salmonella enterica subsp. enterica serovar Typhi str. CT18]HAD5785011.1 phage tail protein [Salmonella enterica subsp. enterica serovar Typhi str. CT18]HAD5852007.1 phage tail protein [Salmonella enterica subsp. enterica serovar Typhi str. CT18]HAD5921836.1 phage tail protein [Salmonella enterica subsp. enterica serovar Typhi str. CT18]
MAKNDFKPFATGKGANVTSQPDWEALPALLSGFTAGKASSAQVNKALRQASFIAAALAQYTASKSGKDVLDDGDLSGFIAKMSAAFGKDFQTLDATLTALAGLATGADKLPYFTGNDTAGQTDLTSVGRDIIGKASIADILTYLGLGETINLAKNAVPATRRVNSKPLTGDITLWASDVGAISADAVGEITDNSTMASANAPGWWKVAVSNSDTVVDFPTYPGGSKLYSYGYLFVEKIGDVWFQHYYAHIGANAKRQDWGTVPNTSRPWVIDYNTANKPSASDVGALPITGGRLNGPLSIGTDNALGGNSIVLGDNDTGFKQNGDGILDTFANSQHTVRVAPGEMQVLGAIRAGDAKRMTMTSSNNSVLNAQFHLWGDGNRPTVIELDDDQGWHLYSQRNTDGSIQFVVNGQVIPDNYGNFDARYLTSGNVYTKGESDNRYVQNIQRGAPVWPGKVDEYGPAEAPAGCFLTQARHDPTTAYGVTFAYRPLQMWVGNGWRTING